MLDFSSSGYQSKSFEVSDMQVKPSLTNVITRCKAGIVTAEINFAGYESLYRKYSHTIVITDFP